MNSERLKATPASVGIRLYLLQVHRRGDRRRLSFEADAGGVAVPAYVSTLINERSAITDDADRERGWYFEQRQSGAAGCSRGYIHNGSFGSESAPAGTRTRIFKHKREVDPSQIAPIFYEFWHAATTHHIFVVFQSVEGRSCLTSMMKSMQDLFEEENPGFIMRFKKLVPNDSFGNVYKNYPVQKVTLIKRNVSPELSDRYSGTRLSEPANLEVSLVARRKGSIGSFGRLARQLGPREAGASAHDGLTFDEATASVPVGGRVRLIGVFGDTSEAGVIDLTNAVRRGTDGHADFDSISDETRKILEEFHGVIGTSETTIDRGRAARSGNDPSTVPDDTLEDPPGD